VTFPGRRAPTGEPDWLTLGQAAKFLGVAQSTIRKWSDQGRVPAFYTPGGHRRYRRRDLEAFLDRSGPGGKTSGPLVLVVDDDPRLREFMRVNLEMEGYSVREAASADEALERWQPVDVLVTDVVMPGMSGQQLAEHARERAPDLRVVFMSGHTDDVLLRAGASRGDIAFVQKPFTRDSLLRAVEEALAQ
jgi:excisionase family DNA binding protein